MKDTMKWFLIISCILLVLAVAYYFFLLRNPGTLKTRHVTIGTHDVAVEIADTDAARAQGLSGREGLQDGHGMLFVFGAPGRYGFWMKDMKFTIDIIWILGDRVAGIAEHIAPEPGKSIFTLTNYYPPETADKVLELGAGAARANGIAVGDKVRFDL